MEFAFYYMTEGRDYYLLLQEGDGYWDWTLYDQEFAEIDGGQLDEPEADAGEAELMILSEYIPEELRETLLCAARSDYDPSELAEQAEEAERRVL